MRRGKIRERLIGAVYVCTTGNVNSTGYQLIAEMIDCEVAKTGRP